jgi:hypothetical protein
MLEFDLDEVSQTLVFAMGGTGQEPAWMSFVPFAMVLAILYFLILMPMRRQRKKVQEFQDALKVGDKGSRRAAFTGSSPESTTSPCSSRSRIRSGSTSPGRASVGIRARNRSSDSGSA